MINRTRRLRRNQAIRNMVAETKLHVEDLIYPIFIEEGNDINKPIESMPGIHRYSLDQLANELDQVIELKIPAILLFGIPSKKDDCGSSTWDDQGIIQQSIRWIKKHYPSLYIITDVCFCEYTDHGHCGVIKDEQVDNDLTLVNIQKQALSHAQAGADMIAPSGMMDGTIQAIRSILDEHQFVNLPIMSYAVKYASAYYGPFRDAADSSPSFGDRNAYQLNPANRNEGILRAAIDASEGADILMVKPALSYLDMIRDLKNEFQTPLACYHVSGEYAMIKAAAEKGWLNEEKIILETHLSMKRAGADLIITYFAKDIARLLKRD